MENVEAKEVICTTHGHELRWGNDGERGGTGRKGIKGRKKWDNYNSIIKNIYFLESYFKALFFTPTRSN